MVYTMKLNTYEEFTHILTGMGLNLTHPILDRLECLHVIDRVREDDAHRSLIVRLGDGLEAFLTSSVPYLHLDALPIHLDGLEFEVDSCNS
jgi:hypothetical protein